MSNNSTDETSLDLESAYREALRAVSATDLPEFDQWNPSAESGKTTGDSEESQTKSRNSSEETPPSNDEERIGPRQILEAALFVGGIELTGEKLASLLKGEFTAESVGRLIDDLNRRYQIEQRPYEIRHEEQLYRLALRPEFEPLRRRVYGLGPKEIKLSQEALEILSLIAYRQPISRASIESLREGNAGNVLRQLVRRKLIALERNGEDAEYVTTDRFLDVFGLANLSELPRAESLEFK